MNDTVRGYGDAVGYDAYMGGWSRDLAPLFLRFAAIGQPASLLDVGCGTGKLLIALQELLPAASLVGIDPSAPQIARASTLLPDVELIENSAETLPFVDNRFGACLSLLVLQEFADLTALSEMRRVTSSDGVVASCVWDFPKMPVIAALIDGLRLVEPDPAAALTVAGPEPYGSEGDLERSWRATGLRDVTTHRIRVSHAYASFKELWQSLTAGSTPSTMRLASLAETERAIVHDHMQETLVGGAIDEPLILTAEALAVRGLA